MSEQTLSRTLVRSPQATAEYLTRISTAAEALALDLRAGSIRATEYAERMARIRRLLDDIDHSQESR